MTHRNEIAKFHAAFIFNGESHDLGAATFDQIMKRTYATLLANQDTKIESFSLLCARSAVKLKSLIAASASHSNPDGNLLSLLDPDALSGIETISDDTPSPFPDISLSRLIDARASPEFRAYEIFASQPDNRIGVG